VYRQAYTTNDDKPLPGIEESRWSKYVSEDTPVGKEQPRELCTDFNDRQRCRQAEGADDLRCLAEGNQLAIDEKIADILEASRHEAPGQKHQAGQAKLAVTLALETDN